MRPEVIVPVLMGCALLWWIGRGMGWTTRLMVMTITLVVIVAILLVERAIQ
jgi:high-affinity Fe2+/Pb2+ permease